VSPSCDVEGGGVGGGIERAELAPGRAPPGILCVYVGGITRVRAALLCASCETEVEVGDIISQKHNSQLCVGRDSTDCE